MKIALLLAAASLFPIDVMATRVGSAQDAMERDLDACARPSWPAGAPVQGGGKITVVEVKIGADGRVNAARVKGQSGRADFDGAALASIRQCMFNAVHASGAAPTGWLQAQYLWRQHGTQLPLVRDEALLASTRKQAAHEDAEAQNRLGAWYERGWYVEQDLLRAAAWYRLAAQAGNAVAQNNLGVLYNRGAGVRRDPSLAVYWYAKAAQQGHGWAQANLAWAYQHGSAGVTDMGQALYWLTRSAQGGLADAQARLGFLAMGRATSIEERAAAAAWLSRAAAQDHPTGLYYLGRTFELGKGNVQDDGAAVASYRQALGRSGGRAETALGRLIEDGRAPAEEDDEARKLYQVAMEKHDADAYYRYGRLLERRGDPAGALEIFRTGAHRGSCECALRYVGMRRAMGVPPARVGHDDLLGQAMGCVTRPRPAPPL